jgi:hypothetical protein
VTELATLRGTNSANADPPSAVCFGRRGGKFFDNLGSRTSRGFYLLDGTSQSDNLSSLSSDSIAVSLARDVAPRTPMSWRRYTNAVRNS